jgi:NAD-dependent DNA ligase
MTLTRCQVQAADAFTYGQTYVALSRCVSSQGLWVEGATVTPKAVKAHKDVLRFMKVKPPPSIPYQQQQQQQQQPQVVKKIATEEQLAKMAQSRANALERKRLKQLKVQQQNGSAATPSAATSSATRSTTPSAISAAYAAAPAAPSSSSSSSSSSTRAFYAAKNQNGMHGVVKAGEGRVLLSCLSEGEPDCLQGMSIVVTGVLPSLNREDAQTLIEKYGGLFRKSVSGKTTYLLVGSILEDGRAVEEGSKYKAAIKKGVTIIEQHEFLRLVGAN